MNTIKSLFHKVQSNPNVVRAEHTFYQAAAGVFVSTLSGTHGDIRAAITIAVAAGIAAVRTSLFPPAAK
jgi:hypothetical protein